MDIIQIRARERPDKRITENGVSPQRSTFKVNISRKTGSANGWIGCHDFPNVFGMKFPGVSILVPTLGTFSPAAFGGGYDPHPYMFPIIVAPRFCRILEIQGGNDEGYLE